MDLSLTIATADDIPTIVALKNKTAQQLTLLHGRGHWSFLCTEKGVLYSMKKHSKLLVVKHRDQIIGALRLTTKKPWAIDVNYFTKVLQPLYIVGIDVGSTWQGKGVGRYMLEQIKPVATAWPAQALRLDAYDNAAGAGNFYRKCGYTERGRVVYKNNPLIYFEYLL